MDDRNSKKACKYGTAASRSAAKSGWIEWEAGVINNDSYAVCFAVTIRAAQPHQASSSSDDGVLPRISIDSGGWSLFMDDNDALSAPTPLSALQFCQ
jgi:hypothetical protein